MMTGHGLMHNGAKVGEDYGKILNKLKVRVHFTINNLDPYLISFKFIFRLEIELQWFEKTTGHFTSLSIQKI